MSVASDTPTPLRHPVAKAWLVHCVTASGAICGMFGIIAVADAKPKDAIIWLAVALVLDGLDGPVARAWAVRERVPRVDGYALDLIVDFVTCIVIPVLFIHEFHMLPQGMSLFVGAFIMLVGALWMSRTDQMTDDNWFNGFPGEWNLVIPTLYLVQANHTIVLLACVLLGATQLTNFKYVHPVQVKHWRPITLSVTVLWLGTMVYATAYLPRLGITDAPKVPTIEAIILLACPAYTVAIGIWRTFSGSRWNHRA